MKLKNILFLVLLFASVQGTFAINESWSQWRGGEKQGVSSLNDLPEKWSEDKNIKWKTTINGIGHSSPVIDNNSIVVSTAFFGSKYKKLQSILQVFILLIGLSFIISLLYESFSLKEVTFFSFISFTGYALILSLVIFFALANSLFPIVESGGHTNITFRWLFSGYVIAGCFILMNSIRQMPNKHRIISIILIIGFAFSVYLFRPYPDYYPELGTYIIPIYYRFYSLILISLLVAIIPIIVKKRKSHENERKSLKINKYLFSSYIVFIFFAGLFGIYIGRFILTDALSVMEETPKNDLYFHNGFIFFGLLLIGGLLLLVSVIDTKPFIAKIKLRFYLPFLYLLMILMFIDKNYLTNQRTCFNAVVCIDKQTGDVKWTKELFEGEQSPVHEDNSFATPTPIINNDTIYAFFGNPGLACLDLEGKIIWENTDLPYEGIHGIGASPVFKDNALIIAGDMPKKPYLVKIDAKTGEIIWKNERTPWNGVHGEHRTPTICKIGEKQVVLIWSKNRFIIYDFASGEELSNTQLECHKFELAASILTRNDTILAPDFKNLFLLDGKKLIANKKNAIIWQKDMRNRGPKCSSPVIYNDMIFTLSDNGVLNCINFKTGKTFWKKRLRGTYLSSLLLVNDRLFASNRKGETQLFYADSVFNRIETNCLPESIYASIAPIDNELFIRTINTLWCISNN